jgi:hypothetical protein
MNDLEHLVSTRLHALADDITPDADPYAQADGAQTLHRRQRRTRVGLAGVAAGIAAVVIGVPIGIGALSSDPGTDVAAPSASEEPASPTAGGSPLPTDAPPTGSYDPMAAEHAERIAELVPGLSLAAPTDGSCPDAAALTRYGIDTPATGSLTDAAGCVWSAGVRNSTQSMPLTGRIQYSPEGAVLDAVTCPTASVPGASPSAELRGCPVGDFNTAWTLVVPAGDDGGDWVISASGGVEDTPDSAADGPSSDGLLDALAQLADETW